MVSEGAQKRSAAQAPRGDRLPAPGPRRLCVQSRVAPAAGGHHSFAAADGLPERRDREPALARGRRRYSKFGGQQDRAAQSLPEYAGPGRYRAPAADGQSLRVPSPRDPERACSPNLPLWYSVRRQAGIEDVRLHDLRHTFASHAVLRGIPLPVVSRLLGHKQPGMTLRYAHVGDRETEAAAERIGAAIARALDDTAAGSIG